MSGGLWYGADEVGDFHPVVEECINLALKKTRLDDKYYSKHHFGQHTSGIPDFSLHDRKTDDYVCIIEVKKTPLDTLGQEAGYQARNYTKQLFPIRWKLGYPPSFCVTNIEYTQFYGLRENSSLIGCLLENSPKISDSIDSPNIKEKFTNILIEYFLLIDQKAEHKFSMYLETISESFNESFYSISQIFGANFNRISNFVNANENLRRGVLYELFRFAFYYYIKEFYLLNNNNLSSYFKKFEASQLSVEEFASQVDHNFEKVMEIDFVDLLKNYDSGKPVFPDMILANDELGKIFKNFIETLERNAPEGIRKNPSLLNYVSLITADIYNKKEMHSTGKIMSDEVLSELLSSFTINSHEDRVLDPCCGDGNLLVSAYKKKRHINQNNDYTHNQLLSDLAGIDIDPNLIQLSAFKLIGQDLNSVNSDTDTNLLCEDFISSENNTKYDAVVMNPPFLRNEDLESDKKNNWLESIEAQIGCRSFIRDVSQPNQYYYFIEKAINKINTNGTGAFILMSKFLNNKDGAPLKKYLSRYLEAVIHYPPSFFDGFAVTTDIFIVKHPGMVSKDVSFVNVKDSSFLENQDDLKRIIEDKNNIVNEKYSIVNIQRKELDSKSNWRLYLIDPGNKFDKFSQIEGMKPIGNFFDNIIRGKADNAGGSSFIYPYSNNNVFKNLVDKIEDKYLSQGLQRNKLSNGRRKFVLTEKCLLSSMGLKITEEILQDINNFDSSLETGISQYLNAIRSNLGDKKFKAIMTNVLKSQMKAEIVIPRGDRVKHSVYYYPESEKSALFSTNFFVLNGYKHKSNNRDKSIKFIAAFLLSSFGQIQFEIHSNSQEGSRKIEKRNIEKFHIPDPNILSEDEIMKTIKAYGELDSLDLDFLGIEENNPRNKLDFSIAEILFSRNNLEFKSVVDFKNYFQEFLKELVEIRIQK